MLYDDDAKFRPVMLHTDWVLGFRLGLDLKCWPCLLKHEKPDVTGNIDTNENDEHGMMQNAQSMKNKQV
jgi:hypothetical protein